jgi:hypothetical protein
MNDMPDACRLNEQAIGWALHALEPDEEMAVLLHLAQCPSCRAAARDIEEVLAGLGASVEQVDPPPSLREGLLARAAETPQAAQQPHADERTDEGTPEPAAPAVEDPRPRHRARRTHPSATRPPSGSWLSRRGRRILAASLALVAVVAIGGLAIRTAQLQQQRDAEVTQAQSLEEFLGRVDQPGAQHAILTTPDGATAAAVLVAGGQMQVLPLGLDPNAVDRTTYVLWGISGEETAPQPMGTFDVASTTEGMQPVRSVAEGDGFSTYAISMEQGRTAPASPSGVIASGQVET